MTAPTDRPTLLRPDLLFADGRFVINSALLLDGAGRIAALQPSSGASSDLTLDLPHRALFPGCINVHSHAFQRLLRGQAESRAAAGHDFWSWRNTMYRAAARLSPDDLYDVARMAFLEMLLAGITTVGEFHYLHNAPSGHPYDDPNLLAKQIIAAAQSVGIRIVLLRSAYLRSGYNIPRDPGQLRFFETTTEFLSRFEALTAAYPSTPGLTFGIAPHSIRAVPFEDLRQMVAFAHSSHLPLHMHISEQVAENEACLREYGRTPVSLLAHAGLFSPEWTAIHAIHITGEEIVQLAAAGVTIGSCPATERNLGDGILPADRMVAAGIPIALGTDSQAQIDPFEDARELDLHLRLAHQQRAPLDSTSGAAPDSSLAARLFDCATVHGARSLAVPAGRLAPGLAADFVTVDLRDPSIASHSAADLLPLLVFGLQRTAIRDVAVAGRLVVRDGRHPLQDEIIARYADLHSRVWHTP